MTQRSYTLDEIDRMRAAVWTILANGAQQCGDRMVYFPPGYNGLIDTSGAEKVTDFRARVEDQLRTYMLAGATPEELEEKAKGAK